MTRLLPRYLSIASAICAVLALATAPQVRACKNSTADKNPSPCSGPSESDASLMFAASTPTTSIPDLNSDAPARTPPVQFGPELRPAARRATPMSASKTGAKTAAHPGKEASAKAEARPAASAEAKKSPAPEPSASKWTASAPRASESASRTIVSRPHRMPSPEIF